MMENKKCIEITSMFWSYISEKKWDAVKSLLAENFEAYWPQSKEKMVGADNFIAVNSHYPGDHKFKVCNQIFCSELLENKTKIMTEVYIESNMPDGSEMKLFAISIFSIKDDKIEGLCEYWADTFPAPEWRKKWVTIC